MEGISSYVGMQAQMLQKSVSMSVMNMAMNQGASLVPEMLSKLPDMSASMVIPEGQTGFNLDVYA